MAKKKRKVSKELSAAMKRLEGVEPVFNKTSTAEAKTTAKSERARRGRVAGRNKATADWFLNGEGVNR